MLKCKSCGASNDANSSVCAICGTPLKKRSKKRPTEYKDIYSNTDPSKNIEVVSDSMDVFSSGEMFEKAKKDQVLDKIYKQELALGEVPRIPKETEPIPEPEQEQFQPTVINRETTSDIVGSHKTVKRQKSRNYGEKIPQRVIESSRPQTDSEKNNAEKKNVKNTKNTAGSSKQKKNTLQPKQPAKQEKLFSEETRRKAKPADEELVPLTMHARVPKRDQSEKKIIPPKYEETALNDTSENRKLNEENKQISTAEKPVKKTQGNKKKQTPAVPARAIPKVISADSKINAVKSDQPVSSVKNRETQAVKDKGENKTVSTFSEKKKPKQKVQTVEIPTAEKALNNTAAKSKPEIISKPDVKTVTTEKKESIKQVKKPPVQNKEIAAASKVKLQQTNEMDNTVSNVKTVKKTAVPKKKRKFFSDEDIAKNSTRAALSYFGILFLIPYFNREKSKLCRAHSKQGIAVFIYSIIVELVTLLLVLGLRILIVWELGLPFALYNVLFAVILAAMAALLIVPVYTGAKAAFGGFYKTVPIVGKYVKKRKNKSSVQPSAERKKSADK